MHSVARSTRPQRRRGHRSLAFTESRNSTRDGDEPMIDSRPESVIMPQPVRSSSRRVSQGLQTASTPSKVPWGSRRRRSRESDGAAVSVANAAASRPCSCISVRLGRRARARRERRATLSGDPASFIRTTHESSTPSTKELRSRSVARSPFRRELSQQWRADSSGSAWVRMSKSRSRFDRQSSMAFGYPAATSRTAAGAAAMEEKGRSIKFVSFCVSPKGE